MDLHLTAFSFPRGPASTPAKEATTTSSAATAAQPTAPSGHALFPDARAVGSRPGMAVPIPLSLAPGSQRSSLSPSHTAPPGVDLSDASAGSDPFRMTSSLSSPSAPAYMGGGSRQAAYTDAVHHACAHAMSLHRCDIHTTVSSPPPNGEGDAASSSAGMTGTQATAPQPPSRVSPLSTSPASAQSPSAPLPLGMDAGGVSLDMLSQTGAAPIMETGLPRFSTSLSGSEAQVKDARGLLLRTLPLTWRLEIVLASSEIMQHGRDVLLPSVRARLDQIMHESGTMLQIEPIDASTCDKGSADAAVPHVAVVITGGIEQIEYARVQILVMLDRLSDLHIDTIDIDSKTLHVSAGRKRATIQSIERESGANIYIPSPFFGVLQNTVPTVVLERRNTVYITGPHTATTKAREMLQVLAKKNRNTVTRQVTLMPRKIDWLLLERLEALRDLMLDNSTFIELPLIGSQQSQVTVHGSSRVDVDRTIRMLMQLVSPCYVATLWLLPGVFDTLGLTSKGDSRALATLLSSASAASGAEVCFHNSCVEICGTDTEVRTALRFLLRQPTIKHYTSEVRFQLELATDHREFISGKKNGKINKIMEGCGVRIRFEPFNDYNFVIEVLGREPEATLQGLGQLQEELPAEMSFYVPEAYHKRIIGVGGKNIQRIMKKFGVYVKFSNAEEFAALGGYIDNDDNVIARTPSKNAPNLENLKNSVMELVGPKDKDFVTEAVMVPRRFHRILLGEKSQVLDDIEHRTRCSVRFARKESALNTVLIVGPESQTVIAAQMLLQHVPLESDYPVNNSVELAKMLESPEYNALVHRLQKDMGVTLNLTKPKNASTESLLRLSSTRANADGLSRAKNALEDLCTKYHVMLQSGPSPVDDVPYNFIPPFSTSHLSPPRASTDGSADLAMPSSASIRYDEMPPPSASNKDLKALFDQPPMPSSMSFEGTGTNAPLVSPFYTPGYADSSALSAQVWGAPIPSLPDMGSHAPKSNVFGAFSPASIPFSFSPTESSRIAGSDVGRNPSAAPFPSTQSHLLRHDGMGASLSNGMDVNAFASRPLSRPGMSMLNPANGGNEIDGFHPLSDPTPRSNLSTRGGAPGTSSMPRGNGLHMSRGSVPQGSANDTMDEVSRVLAQIAFDKQ